LLSLFPLVEARGRGEGEIPVKILRWGETAVFSDERESGKGEEAGRQRNAESGKRRHHGRIVIVFSVSVKNAIAP
jgi:hypothetical protein